MPYLLVYPKSRGKNTNECKNEVGFSGKLWPQVSKIYWFLLASLSPNGRANLTSGDAASMLRYPLSTKNNTKVLLCLNMSAHCRSIQGPSSLIYGFMYFLASEHIWMFFTSLDSRTLHVLGFRLCLIGGLSSWFGKQPCYSHLFGA